MNGTELAIFAAAYALELARRIDVNVRPYGTTAEQWKNMITRVAIVEAHEAVKAYRRERKDTDP